MNYGEVLDSSFDPTRDYAYELFIKYFGDLAMTKIKDVHDYSMYAAKIRCLLSTQNRYVIIFVDNDKLPLGNTDRLGSFRWINLQTRTIADTHGIHAQTYKPRRMAEFMQKINLVTPNTKQYIYHAEKLPLQITLLPKNSNEMEYQPTGSIVSALETYNTIVSFI